MLGTYLTTIFAMSFAAVSALTLFWAIDHLDTPEAPLPTEEHVSTTVSV